MVVARSRALSAVSTFLAAWLDRNANTVRQQLREFCLVAWTVLPAGEKHAWRGEWLRMLRQVRAVVPRRFFVPVLADRGLYARWLFRRIVWLG